MAEPDLNCFALASCLSRLPRFCTKSEEEPNYGKISIQIKDKFRLEVRQYTNEGKTTSMV